MPEDEPELGPGVASHASHEDSPIDEQAVTQALNQALVQSGATHAGPTAPPPKPLRIKPFKSGNFPASPSSTCSAPTRSCTAPA